MADKFFDEVEGGENTNPAASIYVLGDNGTNTYWILLSNLLKNLGSYIKTAYEAAAGNLAASAVQEADFNANTILAANADDTPLPVTVAEETLLGRITGGNIDDLTPLQARGLLTEVNAQTGTSYTTQDSDNGKIITLSNGSAITLTVHQAAAANFGCLLVQLGAGQVTVAAGGTGNVRNYDTHTKLAGQYAMGSVVVVSNAGTAPEVYLAGNTAA